MIPEPKTLALFTAASAALIVTPGPAVMYIVSRSVAQGRTAGFASVIGVGVGTLVHVFAAALGVSAAIAASPKALLAVQYAGAAYLLYLGMRTLRTPPAGVSNDSIKAPVRSVFLQGMLVNLLNPKTTLFILSFLPQFVSPRRGPVALQILFLGCVLVTIGFFSDGGYALLAGTLAERLKDKRWAMFRSRLSGFVYLSLAAAAALSGR